MEPPDREQVYSEWIDTQLPRVAEVRREVDAWRERRAAIRLPVAFKLGGAVAGLVVAVLTGVPHLFLVGLVLPFGYEAKLKLGAGRLPEDISPEIFREAFGILAPNLEYTRQPTDEQGVVRQAGLFPEEYNRIRLLHGVGGRHGEAELRFRRVVLVQVKPSSTKGQPPREQVNFSGVLFDAASPKDFKGTVHVLPDSLESKFGEFGRLFQSLDRDRKGELIRLECPEFERRFKVYATDPVEARYLLSTSFMENLVRLCDLYEAPLRLSFVDGRVWLAYESQRPYFDVPRANNLQRKHFDSWADDLVTITGHLDDLNLGTRIWARAA